MIEEARVEIDLHMDWMAGGSLGPDFQLSAPWSTVRNRWEDQYEVLQVQDGLLRGCFVAQNEVAQLDAGNKGPQIRMQTQVEQDML